jgi:N12 class adenine-specific DNA methylase
MQGEREALLEDIKSSSNQVIEQQAEIEKLTINMNAFGLGMKREKERADTIRAEAIKEYMKILEEKLSNNVDISNVGYQSIIFDMEQVYKEMVGDDK